MYENEFIELCQKKTPKQTKNETKQKQKPNKQKTNQKTKKQKKQNPQKLLFTSSIASIRAHNKSR